jgi:hypothetical protein
MRLTLLAAILAALTMTACSKPNQALPEQEKKNYDKITSQPAAPAAPAATDSGAPAASTGTDTSASTSTSSTVDATKDK